MDPLLIKCAITWAKVWKKVWFIATKSFRWEHPVMRTMWTSRSNHLSYKTWTVVSSSEWPLSFESRCRAEPCPVKVALLCFAIWLLLFLQCWGLCTPCCIAQYITISLSFFFFFREFCRVLVLSLPSSSNPTAQARNRKRLSFVSFKMNFLFPLSWCEQHRFWPKYHPTICISR